MAAPQVGDLIDGYEFLGGDPKNPGSWQEWGAGARKLPTGAIVRDGPRGGMQVLRPAEKAPGTTGGVLATPEQRAKLMLSVDPMVQAQQRLEAMESDSYRPKGGVGGLLTSLIPGIGPALQARMAKRGYSYDNDWGARMLEAVPFDGGAVARAVGGEDYQEYEQAARTYEASVMPLFSGAAVTESEAKRLVRADLPQLWDTKDNLKRKSDNRRMRINASAEMIGRPHPFPSGEGSSVDNPIRLTAENQAKIPEGAFFLAPDGRVYRNRRGAGPAGQARPAKPAAGPARQTLKTRSGATATVEWVD